MPHMICFYSWFYFFIGNNIKMINIIYSFVPFIMSYIYTRRTMLKSLGLWKSSLSFKGTPINQISLFDTIDTRCSMGSEGYQGSVDNDPSTEQTTVVLAPEFLQSTSKDEQLIQKSYEQSFDKSNSIDTNDRLEIMPLS